MAYTTDEQIEPFSAQYSSEASGRDPLAIQNSSVVIYTKMIVGITNVTNRIRYLGFYCWLIETIGKEIKKSNSLTEQIRYIRRAELLLAYIMVNKFKGITGVSGSIFAVNDKKSEINLISGADFDNEENNNLYWKNRFGIFGQYYSAVLRELNLINHPQLDVNIYTLTSKGEELAKAFKNNIHNDEELFWKSVYNGLITKDELTKLESFALHIIPPNSDEHKFYQKILVAEDDRKIEPTFNRRNSIQLILYFLSTENGEIENLSNAFLNYNYFKNIGLTELTFSTSAAWYLFEINELLHVAYEYFHSCFLFSVQKYPTPIDDCINMLIEEIINSFNENGIDARTCTIKKYCEILEKENIEVYKHYNLLFKQFRDKNYGNCLIHALKTILTVYLNCFKHKHQLKELAFLSENNFNRNGYAIELFDELIETKFHLTLSEYSKAIILTTINQHTFSSYSKTRIGQSLVHNYMIENDTVWRLRETEPSRTSPRLQNLVQYMIDINWINKEGKKYKITDLGIEILNSL